MKTIFFSVALFAAALCARAEIPAADLLNEGKLIEVLQKADTSDNDKVTACQNLGWCGTESAVAPLSAFLANEKPVLRHAARYGLEMIPDPAVIHCASPLLIKPLLPRLSPCSIKPSTR